LLFAPLRLHNLSTLRLDRQLQWPTGRGGTLFITLREDETKNALPLEYPINGQSKALVHEYLDRFRSYSGAQKNPWFFVRRNGVPVPAGALRDGITKAVRRELGVELTPHQFRHLAAMTTLNARPGAIGLVKDLLGHRNIKTTLNFYAGMRTREAAQEFDKILEAHRQS
jgi:integrase